ATRAVLGRAEAGCGAAAGEDRGDRQARSGEAAGEDRGAREAARPTAGEERTDGEAGQAVRAAAARSGRPGGPQVADRQDAVALLQAHGAGLRDLGRPPEAVEDHGRIELVIAG